MEAKAQSRGLARQGRGCGGLPFMLGGRG